MSNPFHFDGTVSLGNILVVLALIVSILSAWMANRERTFDNAAAIVRLDAQFRDLEVRLRAVEKR
jgi:hypothetical protein